MEKIDNDKLENIVGGSSTITGTILSAFTNIIRILYDAGEGVGSAIRRLSENELCPLK